MESIRKGQLSRSAAEVYDTFFVPALFGDWPPRVADAAALRPGQAVLDVACGTGILAREAARRVAPGGTVTGLDCNEGMLAVARRVSGITWRSGSAEDLPFPEDSFDRVLCQFGLMFFNDPATAVREMARVLAPRGRLVIAVWDALERTPGYADMVGLLHRLFGPDAAEALRVPYRLGNADTLRALVAKSGLPEVAVRHMAGMARFPSIRDWVTTDVKGWTLGDAINDAEFETLVAEAERTLAHHRQVDGTVAFPAPALVAVALDSSSA